MVQKPKKETSYPPIDRLYAVKRNWLSFATIALLIIAGYLLARDNYELKIQGKEEFLQKLEQVKSGKLSVEELFQFSQTKSVYLANQDIKDDELLKANRYLTLYFPAYKIVKIKGVGNVLEISPDFFIELSDYEHGKEYDIPFFHILEIIGIGKDRSYSFTDYDNNSPNGEKPACIDFKDKFLVNYTMWADYIKDYPKANFYKSYAKNKLSQYDNIVRGQNSVCSCNSEEETEKAVLQFVIKYPKSITSERLLGIFSLFNKSPVHTYPSNGIANSGADIHYNWDCEFVGD